MKCEICDKEFESRRSDARFCSSHCRVIAKRRKDYAERVTDKLSVTDNPESVTDSVTGNLGFEDLPKDVQEKIDAVCRMRAEAGLFDDRVDRIARALHYQGLYPG